MLQGEVKTFEGSGYLEYLQIGNALDKPTLLFLHGFADSKDTFYDAAGHLAEDFNIIVPDLPGFGNSFQDPSRTYDLESYSQWIAEFCDGICLDNIHLVGNSLGGAIAMAFALRAPEKISNLCLIDPAGIFIKDKPSLYYELFKGSSVFAVKTYEDHCKFMERVFHKSPIIPTPVREHLFRSFARHTEWYEKLILDLLGDISHDEDPRIQEKALNHRLQEISHKTLIMWGDKDSLFPFETGHYIANQIPGSKLHVFKNCGHSPQIESPKLFADTYLRHFIPAKHSQRQTRRIWPFAKVAPV